MNEDKFKSIPERACMFAGGEVTVKDAGENAKTAPVRVKARSGQPLEHWFWGRVVHDLTGMRMHKTRLALDYAHNDSEVIGYLNHFDASSGDLMASGAIIPFTAGDRAEEVLFKMKQGVPYEASIFFGGDGIKIEEVQEGECTQVNGYKFEGPGCVIREWPLRGVAVCPYGADQNTETMAMSAGKTYVAEQFKAKGIEEMKAEQKAVEVKASDEVKPVEVAPVETEAVKLAAPEVKPEEVKVEVASPEKLLSDGKTETERLSAELETVKRERETALANVATAEKAHADAMAALQKAQDEVTREKALRVAAEDRLKAMEKGAAPVSAGVAELKNEVKVSAWKRAQRR